MILKILKTIKTNLKKNDKLTISTFAMSIKKIKKDNSRNH